MDVGIIIHNLLVDNLLKTNPAKAAGFCRHFCGAVLFQSPPFLVLMEKIPPFFRLINPLA
jgi:hypothetical protein